VPIKDKVYATIILDVSTQKCACDIPFALVTYPTMHTLSCHYANMVASMFQLVNVSSRVVKQSCETKVTTSSMDML